MKLHVVKCLCLLAVLLTLPVTATAQQRRGEERRTNDRSSSERRTDERNNSPRESNREGNGRGHDRAADDRRPPHRSSATFNPLLPSWEQKPTPWWERQAAPWWEGGSRTRPNPNNADRRDDYRYRSRYTNGGVIYVVPTYPYAGDTPSTSSATPPPPDTNVARRPAPEPPPAPPAVGFLNLDVEPRALLQIYVDDVFLGTPSDLGDELRLAPGTRRIELRAKGFKTLTFSAEIVEHRSINYSGALDRDPAAPSPPVVKPAVVPAGAATMYMIQGCYLGNIAPRPVDLRPGCDIAKLVTFKP